jgi:nucleoside 2-deoxyribosyltransferase
MNIYIAGPLFNQMETERNQEIAELLEAEDFQTYLPQRDGGLFYDFRNQGFIDSEIRNRIFLSDYDAILKCDIILCLLDGRVLDEGMCIELGIAYALKKTCIGFKTDYRCQDMFGNNIMLEGTLSKIFYQKSDLLKHFRKLRLNQQQLAFSSHL